MKSRPERLALLGHPLGHSLSPVMHNAALRTAGIPLVYEALDVPRRALDSTIESLRRTRAAGNVTIPYKEDVLAACDRLTATAIAVGAVNTFWIAIDGALVGDNTDAPGFEVAATHFLGRTPTGATIAVIGAGGGAAAVLRAMKGWEPREVRLYSRTMARARALAQRFALLNVSVVESADVAVDGAAIVVNASPVGLSNDAVPVRVEALRADAAVLDLVYRRGETAFVRAARARGLRAQDGLALLVEQGALAFERWFSVQPDREVMWNAVWEFR
ncbi:MAG: shikimate dehydrogenase [Gemmatimonadota bacterium]|mgnify:CR=1 FL=1